MDLFIRRAARRLVVGFFVLAGSTFTVQAAPIVLPAGLNPGDSYRLAFVTSATITAEFTDINVYNTFVNNLTNGVAELSALSLSWTAIASTSGVDARDNTNTNPGTSTGAPIYLLDGVTMIANDNTDLWDDDIGAPLNIDENGNVVAATQAWTGSNTDGTGRVGQELGSPLAISGDTNLSNFFWITLTSHPRTTSWRMYAISETITIPGGEPEVEISGPGHLALMAIGLVGIGITRRRIRR
jgi:hypothetical protein